MEPITVGLIALGLLLVLIIFGFHIAVSLMIMSIVGIYLTTGNIEIAVNILGTTAYSSIREYVFGVIPLFVLMGLLANLSGASAELYDAANAALRRIRGGLGIATVVANAIFAAITGVSIASAAVFTKIAVPEMTRLGYNKRFAVGTVAGSSVLGMLIPPSILMIVYGMLAEVSIGKLFVAGIIPGILLSVLFILCIVVLVRIKPDIIQGHEDKIDYNDNVLKKVAKTWSIMALVVITLGGIWAGFFTPTEAGGVGAFGAFLLVIIKGKFKIRLLWDTFLEAGITTGSILFLLISAQMYSRMLAISGVIGIMGDYVTSLQVAPMAIIVVFMLIMIVLGCILDSTSILLLTMPLMCPIVSAFGMDLIWFGIVAIVAIETGLLTPPFGLSVYTIKSALSDVGDRGMGVEEIFRGSFPFLIVMFISLIILLAFPVLSTFLVNLM